MFIQVVDKNFDHVSLNMLNVAKASWNSFIQYILKAFSAVICAVCCIPHVWNTDLRFEDLRLGSLFITHMHGELRNRMSMEARILA